MRGTRGKREDLDKTEQREQEVRKLLGKTRRKKSSWKQLEVQRRNEFKSHFKLKIGMNLGQPGGNIFSESLILAQDERWRRA